MSKNYKIVTNNYLVHEKYKDEKEVVYFDVSYGDILNKVRDMVHSGHRLLTHPLSGSIKPNETPFKSMLLSVTKAGSIDFQSLEMIENAVVVLRNFPVKYPNMPEKMREDFALIDLSLIESALPSAVNG